MENPNWQRLCADTSYDDWDCERGHAISSDLWWTARLFYDRAVSEESSWIKPFVSPCGDGSIHFSWVYGYRRFSIEITDGLWYCSEKDGSWRQSVDGHLPDEIYDRLQAFYKKCLTGKAAE